MKTELERRIEGRIVRWAVDHGWIHRKLNGLGAASWPDQLFLFRETIFAFMEVKRLGEVPTPLQHDMLNDLKARGFNAVWFDNSEEAIEYLRQLAFGTVPRVGKQVVRRGNAPGAVAPRKVPKARR